MVLTALRSRDGRPAPVLRLSALGVATTLACLAVQAQTQTPPAGGAAAPAVPAAAATPPTPPTPQMAASSTPSFAIKGFRINGDNPLDEALTRRVLAPFARPDATIDTLQKATTALEAALRDRGYGLHRVALPPQEVGETVQLDIVKFTIGKVRVEGLTRYNEANIRASLPELKEGTTPNFRDLAVQTTIANENPVKQTSVSLKEGDEPDQVDATVQVRDGRPWAITLSASNAGNESSGRDRITVAATHSNVFNADHQFVGAYTTSAEAGDRVKQLGLSYRVPVYSFNSVVGLSYTRSDVIGNFGAFTSTGAGATFAANLTVYLPPDGGYRHYLSFTGENKLYEAAVVNGTPVGNDRRSTPFTIGYSGRRETDTSVLGFNVDFALNAMRGTFNKLSSYQGEDPRITTAAWQALRFGASYGTGFASGWLFGARLSGQYSRDALISGEQFGLGGSGSLRGTPNRITGDSGYFASLEVTTPELAQGLRGLVFAEGGRLFNHSPNGTSKLASDGLASVGLGLRYGNASGVSVSADWGRLVRGSTVPLAVNASAPQKGEDKLHLNLSVRF